MYDIRFLPADHGDCILLTYGDAAAPARILIDGGTSATWGWLRPVIEGLREDERRFELLVVTHVDADHIGGALDVLGGGVPGLDFEDVWFNGYRHLSGLETQGPVQGEKLTEKLWPHFARWNKAWGGKAVVVPDDGAPPSRKLASGMTVTLLSPTAKGLQKLLPVWEKACAEAGLDPRKVPPQVPEGLEPMGAIDVEGLAAAPFHEDTGEANGSSIAFLAEFGGKVVLFAGDAHPSVLTSSIRRLPGGKARVDAFKLPHHGSKHNVSSELLAVVDTTRYAFSTNGSHFKHPDREAVARIVSRRIEGCELRFNYRSDYTTVWESAPLQKKWRYSPRYPDSPDPGDRIVL